VSGQGTSGQNSSIASENKSKGSAVRFSLRDPPEQSGRLLIPQCFVTCDPAEPAADGSCCSRASSGAEPRHRFPRARLRGWGFLWLGRWIRHRPGWSRGELGWKLGCGLDTVGSRRKQAGMVPARPAGTGLIPGQPEAGWLADGLCPCSGGWTGSSPCLRVIWPGEHRADLEQRPTLLLSPSRLAQQPPADVPSCWRARGQGTAR